MKIAYRLALSFALLGAVLIAVVGYHGRVIRDLQLKQRDLKDSLPVAYAIVRMEQSIDDQRDRIRKILALRQIGRPDLVAGYVGKLESLRAEFSKELEDLELERLTTEEQEAHAVVVDKWKARTAVPLISPDDSPPEPTQSEDVRRGSIVPAAYSLDTDLEEAPMVALDDEVPSELPPIDNATELALNHLSTVETAVEELRRTVVFRTPTVLKEEADAAAAQLNKTNRLVLIAMLIAGAIIWFMTSRAISRPLGELIDGTRAVADGRFEVQLDAGGSDEISRVAAAFNTMARRLAALDRMKKDFVARVSHDLRTPLVAMQETSDLLLAGLTGPLNEDQSRLVRLNRESGRRLGGRIANLLALSRIEAGAFELDMKEHDLGELARFVLRELLVPARRRGMQLDLALPERPILVRLDSERITQVLENLLDNAIKHTPHGGRIGFRIRAVDAALPPSTPGLRRKWPTAGHVEITVTDSGPGVAEADRDRIFHSFYRADAQPATHGTGLGLAICRDLVEAHNGTIWVDDAEQSGDGARFHVVLPWEKTDTDVAGGEKRVARNMAKRSTDDAPVRSTV